MRTALALFGFVVSVAAPATASDKVPAASGKIRVFVSESWSSETVSTAAGGDSGAAATSRGGARPQTAEIIKTLRASCTAANATSKAENADYVLLLEHEGGKVFGTDNKWVVFDRAGDAIGSGSTRLLGSSVKDACQAMAGHWSAKP